MSLGGTAAEWLALCCALPVPACAPAGGYKQHDDHENDAHVKEVAQFAVQQVWQHLAPCFGK